MILLVFGKRKTGKTELTRQISYYLARESLCLVSDPIGQWPGNYARRLEDLPRMATLPRLITFCEDEAADVAYTARRLAPNVTIFDEMDFLCSARSWKSDDGEDICKRGRHIKPGGVGLVLNTQRTTSCHSDLRSLCDKVCVFQMDHPLDLDAFSGWLGPQYAEAIERLPQHHFVMWPDAVVCKLGLNGERAVQMSMSTLLAQKREPYDDANG